MTARDERLDDAGDDLLLSEDVLPKHALKPEDDGARRLEPLLRGQVLLGIRVAIHRVHRIAPLSSGRIASK